jgi:hypothetical protein
MMGSTSSTSEEEEEVKEKLRQKGYDINTPGEELLIKELEELEKQVLQVTKQRRAQLEQKKPEDLSEEEARYLEWAKRWLKAKEEQHER